MQSVTAGPVWQARARDPTACCSSTRRACTSGPTSACPSRPPGPPTARRSTPCAASSTWSPRSIRTRRPGPARLRAGRGLAAGLAGGADRLVQDAPARRDGARGGARPAGRPGAGDPGVLAAFGIVAVGAPTTRPTTSSAPSPPASPGPIEVATGDRDLFQLVDDARGVRVLYCGTGRGQARGPRRRRGRGEVRRAGRGVRRLRRAARRPERRAARRTRRRREDGGPAGRPVRQPRRDRGRARRPGRRLRPRAARPSWPPPRDYLPVAPAGGAGGPRRRAARRWTPRCRVAPRIPSGCIELAEQWGLAGAVRRLVDASARWTS